MPAGVVVAGASLAGLRTAFDLRAEGYDGPITLIGDEPALPYDRPPLSKGVLSGEDTEDSLALCTGDEISGHDIDLRIDTRVRRVDLERRTLDLAGRESVPFDDLVIATGARCRRPAWYRPMRGVHELRTLADARTLRETLSGARSLVVVGGGFIGTEVAASARSMGVEVTMLLREPLPLAGVLGLEVGHAVRDLHAAQGVDIRPVIEVTELVGRDAVEGVRLGDGTVIVTEAVLVAVGAVPQVDWLAGSELHDPRGVAVDERGCAGARVWAAGDVVRGAQGHWAKAVAQAKTVAAGIAGKAGTARPVSVPDYFWSDQYHHKFQVLGEIDTTAPFQVLHGALDSMSCVGTFGNPDRITGALLIDQPKNLGRMRRLVGRGASLAECREEVV
ncbi:oxidoreductase [Nocardia speluncae]|uniref:Oxidoreductase n=1 Tax=Nocardia speluncae TaxID=419477 RepID=A0A846XAI2_9NOCA|nr:FAD-dependent oxidoreductase [Nocardia speluncae]NKY32457.1 oxidoreductase [Nocardia speluncae]